MPLRIRYSTNTFLVDGAHRRLFWLGSGPGLASTTAPNDGSVGKNLLKKGKELDFGREVNEELRAENKKLRAKLREWNVPLALHTLRDAATPSGGLTVRGPRDSLYGLFFAQFAAVIQPAFRRGRSLRSMALASQFHGAPRAFHLNHARHSDESSSREEVRPVQQQGRRRHEDDLLLRQAPRPKATASRSSCSAARARTSPR